MFEKLKSFYNLFQQGKEVANPEAWKKGQITGTALAAAFLALAGVGKSFGYELPIDEQAMTEVAVGVIAVVNVVLTIVTSKKVGLKEKQ